MTVFETSMSLTKSNSELPFTPKLYSFPTKLLSRKVLFPEALISTPNHVYLDIWFPITSEFLQSYRRMPYEPSCNVLPTIFEFEELSSHNPKGPFRIVKSLTSTLSAVT